MIRAAAWRLSRAAIPRQAVTAMHATSRTGAWNDVCRNRAAGFRTFPAVRSSGTGKTVVGGLWGLI